MTTIIRIISDAIDTMLSQEQQQEILVSLEQINCGLFVTKSDLDDEINKWLEE